MGFPEASWDLQGPPEVPESFVFYEGFVLRGHIENVCFSMLAGMRPTMQHQHFHHEKEHALFSGMLCLMCLPMARTLLFLLFIITTKAKSFPSLIK